MRWGIAGRGGGGEKSAIYFTIKSALYALQTEAITTAHFSFFDMRY